MIRLLKGQTWKYLQRATALSGGGLLATRRCEHLNENKGTFPTVCKLLDQQGCRIEIGGHTIRYHCTSAGEAGLQDSSPLETLKFQRSVLLLEGADRYSFLQGLVTNDVEQLMPSEEGKSVHSCIYSLLLNPKGRFLHDMFIYNVGNEMENALLLDVDLSSLKEVMKLLNRYRLRSKVKIKDVSDQYSVLSSAEDKVDETVLDTVSGIHAFKDPRHSLLGYRLLVEDSDTSKDYLAMPEENKIPVNYTRLRFELGIPEGDAEIPSGKAIPLEYNMDSLNSISFTKGCYMGQELTARTHFQGLIRKRLIPITISADENIMAAISEFFQNAKTSDMGEGALEIIDLPKKKKVGNMIAAYGNKAFALLRLKGLQEKELGLRQKKKSGETEVLPARIEVQVPEWWPEEWHNSPE